MKIKSVLIFLLIILFFIGCGSSKPNNSSLSKKNLYLQPLNLFITTQDDSYQGMVNTMYDVIGEKLEREFSNRIISQKEITPYGIKIEVSLIKVDYVGSMIRFFFKDNSGDAILKLKVVITDLYKKKMLYEGYIDKKSHARRGKGKSTPDHIEEAAEDIVFILKSSRI